jgi:hypothetical protein
VPSRYSPCGPEQDSGLSTDELAQQLSNPISDIWSLQLQTNMTFLRGSPSHSYRGQSTTNFQPAMPLHLTHDWNLLVNNAAIGWHGPVEDAGLTQR